MIQQKTYKHFLNYVIVVMVILQHAKVLVSKQCLNLYKTKQLHDSFDLKNFKYVLQRSLSSKTTPRNFILSLNNKHFNRNIKFTLVISFIKTQEFSRSTNNKLSIRTQPVISNTQLLVDNISYMNKIILLEIHCFKVRNQDQCQTCNQKLKKRLKYL